MPFTVDKAFNVNQLRCSLLARRGQCLFVLRATTSHNGQRRRSSAKRRRMPANVLSKQYRFILVSDLDWTMVRRLPRMAGSMLFDLRSPLHLRSVLISVSIVGLYLVILSRD